MKRLVLRNLNIQVPELPDPDPDPPPDTDPPGEAGDVLLSHLSYDGSVFLPHSGQFSQAIARGGMCIDPNGNGGAGSVLVCAHQSFNGLILESTLPAFNVVNPTTRDYSVMNTGVAIGAGHHLVEGGSGSSNPLFYSRNPTTTKQPLYRVTHISILPEPIEGWWDLAFTVHPFYAVSAEEAKSGGVGLSKLRSSTPDARGMWNIADRNSHCTTNLMVPIPAAFQALFGGRKMWFGGYINQGTTYATSGPEFVAADLVDPDSPAGNDPEAPICPGERYMGYENAKTLEIPKYNPFEHWADSFEYPAPDNTFERRAGWRLATRHRAGAFIHTGSSAAIVYLVSRCMGYPDQYVHFEGGQWQGDPDGAAARWAEEMGLTGADLAAASTGRHWARQESTGYQGGPMQWELHFYRPADVAAGISDIYSVMPYMIVPLNRTVYSGLNGDGTPGDRGGSASGLPALKSDTAKQKFWDNTHGPIACPYRIPGNSSEPLCMSIQYVASNSKLYIYETNAVNTGSENWRGIIHRFSVMAA